MRLDIFLNQKYPEYSRSKLSDFIKRGFVTVNDKVITKPGYIVHDLDEILLVKDDIFVSRAGEKINYAFDLFDMDLRDLYVVDVGASTGGFTQSAILRGAAHVFAYELGKDQMVLELKQDPRVTSYEGTNILDVLLPNHDLAMVDVSFTSVIPILNHLSQFSKEIIFLLKPQYEVDPSLLKNGILKEPKVVSRLIDKIYQTIRTLGYEVKGFTMSPVKGKEGNQEYIFYMTRGSNA